MNADQLAAEIIQRAGRSHLNIVNLEKLSTEEAVVLVPSFVRAFKEHRLWPKDAAVIIAACRPTDHQLLEMLQDYREPCQKLGLHILALRIESEEFQSTRHLVLAKEVLWLLGSQAFRAKQKDLQRLKDWADSDLTEAEEPS